MINLLSRYKHSILLALWLMATSAVAANDTPASIRKEFREQIRKNKNYRKQKRFDKVDYYFQYGTDEYREFYRNGGYPVIDPHGHEAASIKDRLNLFNRQYEKDGITFYFFTASIFLDVERGENRSDLKWEDIKEDFYTGTRIQSGDRHQRLETTKNELLINVLSQLSQEASVNNANKVIILFAVRSAIAYKDKDDKLNYKFYVDRGIRTTGIDSRGQANLATMAKDSYESGTHSMADAVSAVAGYFGTYQLLQKYDDLVANTTTTRINEWQKSLDDAKLRYTGRGDNYLLYNPEEVTLSGEVEWKIKNLRYKLDVLSRKTDFRFFIVIQPVPFVIPKDSLNQYADDAHATLGLGDGDLLLTIPFYTTLALQKSPMRVEDFPLKMYGLSIGKNVKYDVLPTMSSLANLYDNFLIVYKHLEKPYILDVTYISYNGDVYHNNRGTSSQSIAGQENIYNYKLLVDTRLTEYHSLCSTYDGLRQSVSLNTLASGENREPEFYEQKADEVEDQIIAYDKLAAAQTPEYHLVDHELWESSLEHLADSVGYRFGYWYAYNSFKDIANTKRAYESPEDKHFISGKNPVVYEENLEAIDNLGLILAPFELDIVADLSGALYAGYYEDWATAGTYGIAVALPGGIKLRQILRGGRFAGFKYLKNLHIQTEFGRAYTSVIPIIPVSIRTHLPLSVLEQLQTEEAIAFINKLREVKLSRSSAQALGEDLKSPELLNAFRKKPDLVEAWSILGSNAIERIKINNLEQLSVFIDKTGFNKTKLAESFSKTNDPRKWIDAKIAEPHLQSIFQELKNNPPSELVPWTAEHKAQRWAQYRARLSEDGSVAESFETWSNKYDGNIEKSNSATKATDEYFNSLAWDCPQQECREFNITLQTPNGPKTRRLDIANINTGKAIEFKQYKEGVVYKSSDIENEVLLDKQLLAEGTMNEIEWVFKGCRPSRPLKELLESGANKIKVTII